LLHAEVTSDERISSVAVVELGDVPIDEFVLFAPVFGVAEFTSVVFVGVKTPVLADPPGHFSMTFEAFGREDLVVLAVTAGAVVRSRQALPVDATQLPGGGTPLHRGARNGDEKD
jgi:hypothetical protein